MSLLPYLGFALLALAAIGFSTFAVWRKTTKATAILAAAIVLFLLGVGGGREGEQ